MIGNRIKQIRLARGLTLQDVASRLSLRGVEITRAGLSKYEQNKSRPGQGFLKALAEELGFPTSVFLEEGLPDFKWHGFRKQAKMTKRLQDHVMAEAAFRAEAQLRLERLLHPGQSSDFPIPQKPASLEDVERIAKETRHYWSLGLGNIPSLTGVAESFGVLVIAHNGEERSREFDGLSGWVNDSIPIAVVSASAPNDRIRFTLAHEIGHLVFNCEHLSEADEERFCHRFASSFLVPDEVLREELGKKRRRISAREFAELKRKHGLSMAAFARRARDLQIISPSQYTAICKEFSQFGWRKKEPVEYEVDELPKRLHQMILRALAEGMISESEANRVMPGVSEGVAAHRVHSSRELMQRPRAERSDFLAHAAESVLELYSDDTELTDFDAFSEEP